MIMNDFYYMCMKDEKVNSNSVGTWLRGLGFIPETSHIDYYLRLKKNYSKNTENDNISLEEFKYFNNFDYNIALMLVKLVLTDSF